MATMANMAAMADLTLMLPHMPLDEELTAVVPPPLAPAEFKPPYEGLSHESCRLDDCGIHEKDATVLYLRCQPTFLSPYNALQNELGSYSRSDGSFVGGAHSPNYYKYSDDFKGLFSETKSLCTVDEIDAFDWGDGGGCSQEREEVGAPTGSSAVVAEAEAEAVDGNHEREEIGALAGGSAVVAEAEDTDVKAELNVDPALVDSAGKMDIDEPNLAVDASSPAKDVLTEHEPQCPQIENLVLNHPDPSIDKPEHVAGTTSNMPHPEDVAQDQEVASEISVRSQPEDMVINQPNIVDVEDYQDQVAAMYDSGTESSVNAIQEETAADTPLWAQLQEVIFNNPDNEQGQIFSKDHVTEHSENTIEGYKESKAEFSAVSQLVEEAVDPQPDIFAKKHELRAMVSSTTAQFDNASQKQETVLNAPPTKDSISDQDDATMLPQPPDPTFIHYSPSLDHQIEVPATSAGDDLRAEYLDQDHDSTRNNASYSENIVFTDDVIGRQQAPQVPLTQVSIPFRDQRELPTANCSNMVHAVDDVQNQNAKTSTTSSSNMAQFLEFYDDDQDLAKILAMGPSVVNPLPLEDANMGAGPSTTAKLADILGSDRHKIAPLTPEYVDLLTSMGTAVPGVTPPSTHNITSKPFALEHQDISAAVGISRQLTTDSDAATQSSSFKVPRYRNIMPAPVTVNHSANTVPLFPSDTASRSFYNHLDQHSQSAPVALSGYNVAPENHMLQEQHSGLLTLAEAAEAVSIGLPVHAPKHTADQVPMDETFRMPELPLSSLQSNPADVPALVERLPQGQEGATLMPVVQANNRSSVAQPRQNDETSHMKKEIKAPTSGNSDGSGGSSKQEHLQEEDVEKPAQAHPAMDSASTSLSNAVPAPSGRPSASAKTSKIAPKPPVSSTSKRKKGTTKKKTSGRKKDASSKPNASFKPDASSSSSDEHMPASKRQRKNSGAGLKKTPATKLVGEKKSTRKVSIDKKNDMPFKPDASSGSSDECTPASKRLKKSSGAGIKKALATRARGEKLSRKVSNGNGKIANGQEAEVNGAECADGGAPKALVDVRPASPFSSVTTKKKTKVLDKGLSVGRDVTGRAVSSLFHGFRQTPARSIANAHPIDSRSPMQEELVEAPSISTSSKNREAASLGSLDRSGASDGTLNLTPTSAPRSKSKSSEVIKASPKLTRSKAETKEPLLSLQPNSHAKSLAELPNQMAKRASASDAVLPGSRASPLPSKNNRSKKVDEETASKLVKVDVDEDRRSLTTNSSPIPAASAPTAKTRKTRHSKAAQQALEEEREREHNIGKRLRSKDISSDK